ncbi:hypothetical protein [Desulfurella sp.]|uniref:hypothetical protein n=1 Tax=Desulfurella sp. TaxID=1962857 RepID=UPI0025C15743|nr:hypothetical protein [Desulfurella sp.]
MKMCEYLNNFISLHVLSKQGLTKETLFVKFDKYVYSTDNIIFNRFILIYYLFRVEKETYMPLHKIIGEHIGNEEKVNKYIKKFGILPIVLDVSCDDSFNVISLEESFEPDLFSGKFKKPTEKISYLIFRGD